MKKILFASIAVMAVVIQPGCKKEKAVDENIVPLIRKMVWTGEIVHDDLLPQPFSLYFDGAGNTTMDETSGTYAGHYSIDSTEKTVTVQTIRGTFTALIKNKKFSTITYAGSYIWRILRGEFNE